MASGFAAEHRRLWRSKKHEVFGCPRGWLRSQQSGDTRRECDVWHGRYAHLRSSEPFHPEADRSELIVCWFGNNLPESVRSCIASQLTTLDWDNHAKDGYF